MQAWTRSAAFLAAMSALASCGGGGGGGGGGGTAVPTTPIALTSTNAQDAAGGATLAGLGSASAGGLFEVALQSNRALPRTHVLAQIMKRQIGLLIAQPISAAQTTTPCDNSGSTTVTDTGPNSVTIAFNACSDAAGESLSGTVSVANIVVNAGVNFSGTASLGLTLKQTGFPDFGISGTNMNVQETVNGGVDTVTMSGTELLATIGATAERLGNYNLVSVFDNNASTETDTVTFDYASTKIGGQVHVSTINSPVTDFASNFPHSGMLSLAGTGGSAIHVIVNSDESGASPQVTIQLDADGNGAIDTRLDKNWSDLDV